MPFHRDRPPTTARVYKYGALAPTTNAETVHDLMRLGHQYQNKLIELERGKRERYHEILGTDSEVAAARSATETAVQRLTETEQRLRDLKSETRKRSPDPELAREVRDLRAVLRVARTDQKSAEIAARERLSDELQRSDQQYRTDQKQARSESGLSGCWATYLLIERSIPRSGPPPRFRRWTGEGYIAVQLQGGLPEADLLSRQDTRLRLQIRDDWGTRSHTAACNRAVLQIRVGSDGRAPIWATVPVLYHRRLPPGSLIKWAQLTRKRVGTRYKWSLCLTVETPGEAPQPERVQESVKVDGRVLALDLGWRGTTRGIRVAYGFDGRRSIEILLPPWVASGYRLAFDLLSIRDQHFDLLRPELAKWLSSHDVPEWLEERASHLSQWRSTARLAGLVHAWRDQRFAGDSEIIERLESWRKQDAHLYDWQRHLERNLVNTRKNLYRHWAKWVSDRYEAVVFESINLAAQKRKPEVGEEGEHIRGAHVPASPGELRSQITQTCQRDGVRVILVPGKNTTRRCAACGELGITRTESLYVACDHCGVSTDQDDNAARQILAFARGGVVSQSPVALAQPEEQWYRDLMREPRRIAERRARLAGSLANVVKLS